MYTDRTNRRHYEVGLDVSKPQLERKSVFERIQAYIPSALLVHYLDNIVVILRFVDFSLLIYGLQSKLQDIYTKRFLGSAICTPILSSSVD